MAHFAYRDWVALELVITSSLKDGMQLPIHALTSMAGWLNRSWNYGIYD